MNAIVVASILVLQSAAAAGPSVAAPTVDPALAAYAKPGELVDIGERKLDLRCSGKGTPVVLLEAGAMSDSITWRAVQPLVAKETRVCSYDRAGYGFSDEGPLPRDVDADAADLHALIDAAKIRKPVILAGHSLGTNIVRRFADKHAGDVAGIVLVDPPPQHTSEFSAEWVKADNAGAEQRIAFASACAKAAGEGKLDKAEGPLAQCIRAPDPRYPDALNAAIRAQKEKPPFWQTLISEMQANIALFEEPVPSAESHGAIPLIVLSASDPFEGAPPEGKKAMEAARAKTQNAIAKTSTRGKLVPVPKSSHDIQLDQPQAVAKAIEEVLATVRASAKPMTR
jgi:pimeloyl-ACP methyl ester carboxylesterase